MNTEELPIHSSIMNVSMEEDIASLDEVVVVAYGTTGGDYSKYSTINSSKIDAAQALGGATSGIKIRGVSANSNSGQPLYILDGVPVEPGSTYANINSNDIAKVNVLKGNKATSIYGSRGSNGVILITTKSRKYTSNGDTIEEGIANTRFEIKKPYTIVSDGDVTVIEIENYSVPASYSYFAAPVVNENVFLTAKIGNWEQYNLLPAEANVYFEGSYSGKTNINPQATTDSLTVSLGVDPNVVVKRNQLNDFKKNTFIGSNKVINKAFEIELKNNKLSTIDLLVYDRIPVSQNKDIKVDDIETGTSDYDNKKGLMTWKLKLYSKASTKRRFSYAVKYPKYKKVNL